MLALSFINGIIGSQAAVIINYLDRHSSNPVERKDLLDEIECNGFIHPHVRILIDRIPRAYSHWAQLLGRTMAEITEQAYRDAPVGQRRPKMPTGPWLSELIREVLFILLDFITAEEELSRGLPAVESLMTGVIPGMGFMAGLGFIVSISCPLEF